MWCEAVQSLSFGPDGADEPAGTGRDVLETVAEQAALRRVATLVARGVPHGELFAVVNQELARLAGADAAALLRFEPDQTITLLTGWSAAGAPVPAGEREPVTAALRRLRDTARPVRFGPSDVPLTGPFITEIRRFGIRAAVAVPIQAGGRVWGVSVAASQSPEPFPPATETLMAAFAELVATAISNAESRAELAAFRTRAIAAADESRRRIQRDLHDGAQQRLVNTILRLKLAKAALEQADHPAAEIVSDALESAEHADADLRELVCGIMPAALRHGGLSAAVRALLRHIGLPVSVEVMPDRLPAHIETTAYFVIAEALTNAVKHARATGADIRAAVCHGALELEIRDDGLGGADLRHGTGLAGLADRVESIDGTITINSPLGMGTTIAVRLPAG
ncbi:MAG TPA: GAF domain-containing protein [Streptosporangiaceae bacterium]